MTDDGVDAENPTATPDSWTESLGVAPDGARLTVSELQDSTSLLLAEGVEGVVAHAPHGASR